MDVKRSLALRKKGKLLTESGKRKRSLRKHLDLKQSEFRLEITQITKCVFLGSLCLKPAPQFNNSSLLVEDMNAKESDLLVKKEPESEMDSKQQDSTQNAPKKGAKRKINCSNKVKKKSLKEESETQTTNEVRDEKSLVLSALDVNEVLPVEILFQKNVPRRKLLKIDGKSKNPTKSGKNSKPAVAETLIKTNYNKINENLVNIVKSSGTPDRATDPTVSETLQKLNNNNINENQFKVISDNINQIREILPELDIEPVEPRAKEIYDFVEDVPFNEGLMSFKLNRDKKPTPEDNALPTFHTLEPLAFNYDDFERLRREPTPELMLSDSDDDVIDQLMLNIMDIKVGPNVIDKEFFEIPSSDSEDLDDYLIHKEGAATSDNGEIAPRKRYFKKTPKCKICSQIFPTYGRLRRHKQLHDGERPYLCVKCNENHTTLDQLIAHLRTHEGKRPYLCKKCNQGFKTPSALKIHQPVHVLKKSMAEKKSFQCTTCGKEFRKLCDLERHTRVHTGEKPSVCNICNKRFQQAHNLNKHLLIHTNQKPFECDVCHKTFGRNDVLSRHLLTHSLEKPNHCEICMKTFIRASQLVSHKEKYHMRPGQNCAIQS